MARNSIMIPEATVGKNVFVGENARYIVGSADGDDQKC